MARLPAAHRAPTTSAQLAPGVFQIKGAYNSLAVEFADHVVLFEPGPQNEARALAGIAETKRLFPNKPIRYGVITHHHFDHTGGIAAVAAEGITIVVPEVNKAFLEKALSGTRTLAPDALAKSGKKAVVEGFTGDKRVFQDATRTVEIHVIKGLPHADGLVVALAAEGKDPGLRGHVQPAAGEQSRAQSAGDRHAGVPGEHRAAGAGSDQHPVDPLDER